MFAHLGVKFKQLSRINSEISKFRRVARDCKERKRKRNKVRRILNEDTRLFEIISTITIVWKNKRVFIYTAQ